MEHDFPSLGKYWTKNWEFFEMIKSKNCYFGKILGNLKTVHLYPIFICIWDMIFQKWENIGKTVLENYRFTQM